MSTTCGICAREGVGECEYPSKRDLKRHLRKEHRLFFVHGRSWMNRETEESRIELSAVNDVHPCLICCAIIIGGLPPYIEHMRSVHNCELTNKTLWFDLNTHEVYNLPLLSPD